MPFQIDGSTPTALRQKKKILKVKEGRFKAALISGFISCRNQSLWLLIFQVLVIEDTDGLPGEKLEVHWSLPQRASGASPVAAANEIGSKGQRDHFPEDLEHE